MTKPSAAAPPPPPIGWRFRLGVALFVLGLVAPVFVPLVLASGLPPEWQATLSGALVLGGPEVLWLAAAAVMGRDGFAYLKERLFAILKRHAPPETVGRTRYTIGLVMFCLPLVFGWASPYATHLIPAYEANRLAVNLAGDLLLLGSLLVLGGGFWDKLRALFVRGARAEFPTPLADQPRAAEPARHD